MFRARRHLEVCTFADETNGRCIFGMRITLMAKPNVTNFIVYEQVLVATSGVLRSLVMQHDILPCRLAKLDDCDTRNISVTRQKHMKAPSVNYRRSL